MIPKHSLVLELLFFFVFWFLCSQFSRYSCVVFLNFELTSMSFECFEENLKE